MGTVIRLSIEHQHPDTLLPEAEIKIRAWESQFSANDPKSDLMNVNQHAGIAPVKVSSEIFNMIRYGYETTLSSNFKMNILIGPLVKLWKIGFKDALKPKEVDIQRALLCMNPENLVLNSKTHEVFLTQSGMEIDLGAIVKGYFADQLQQYFLSHGVSSGIIDLGGNVLTIGRQPETLEKWHVGVRNPFHKDALPLVTLSVEHQSVVTSGIYERYFIQENQLFHHILDSTTGYPVDNDIASVTIISDHGIDGEVWSTICSFGQSQKNIELLNLIDGIEGIIVTRDGSVLMTSKMQKYL